MLTAAMHHSSHGSATGVTTSMVQGYRVATKARTEGWAFAPLVDSGHFLGA